MFNIKLLRDIKGELLKNEHSIAVAESVTAGFLQAAFSSAEEAMQIFQGGITVYNLGQKYRHLSVDPIHAENCNCVSDKVATTMALQVCTLFASDWGIGVTGFASPVPESDNKLFAHGAIAFKGKILVQKKFDSQKEPGIQTQLFYVEEILKELLNSLQSQHAKEKVVAQQAS